MGVNTQEQLREEVNATPIVVGLITPSSFASHYVMFELGARWGASRFIAPLVAGIKPGDLRGPLSLLNALSAESEAQLHQLLKDVSGQLGRSLQGAASYVHHLHAVQILASKVSANNVKQDQPSHGVDVELTPSTGRSETQFLAVRNRGPKQTFRAQCRVLERRNDPNGQQLTTINLEWEHGQRDTSLARGESGNLLIATAGSDTPRDVEWMEVGPEGYNTLKSTWLRDQRDRLPEYDLEITVISIKSDESFSEQFTLRAGTACALEMKRKINSSPA